MGFAEFLTLIFVVAKLAGALSWTWVWVFSPLWIVYGTILLGFGFLLLAVILGATK